MRVPCTSEICKQIRLLRGLLSGKADVSDIPDTTDLISADQLAAALAAYSLDGHTHDDRYYTEGEISALLAGYALASHTHDDRYYTEGEISALLAGYALASHTHDDRYYTEGEISALLAGYALASHTHDDRYYTEGETNSLFSNKLVGFGDNQKTTSFTSSGTGIQVVHGHTVYLPSHQMVEVEVSLSPYQSNVGAAPNARFYIDITGHTGVKVAQVYHNTPGALVHPFSCVARFGAGTAGNREARIYIEPLAGTWLIRDSDDRPLHMIIRAYNY